jgi:tetratricopeptide (TPR) repeat protein
MRQLLAFISYSRADGEPLANRLRKQLRSISPPVEPWMDVDQPRGYPFAQDLTKAIGGCDLLLFVITAGSAESRWCRSELQYAAGIGKRVLALQEDSSVDPREILELNGLQPPIDFRDWERGWSELRRELVLLDAPDARIESLEKQRDAAARNAQNAQGGRRERYRQKAAEFEARIAQERRRQDHLGKAGPQGTHPDQVGEPADAAAALERSDSRIRILTEPPPLFPNLFLDRTIETRRLEDRLRDSSVRLLAVVGSAGIGKTAMIVRLVDDLRSIPGQLPIDAFLYMPADGSRPIGPAILLEELSKIVPDEEASASLGEHLNDSALALSDKIGVTLKQLAGSRVLVVIDSAEALLDNGGRVRDYELDELFRGLLSRSDHGVKLVLASRSAPEPLLRQFPVSTDRLQVDNGLPSPDTMRFLRSLDSGGVYELGSAPEEHLEEVRRLTDGNPRALELVYSVLEGDPELSLPQFLQEMDGVSEDEDMLSYLVGRLFDRLDPVDRRVMQALSIYGRPVPATAVDYLLHSYLEGYESETTLQRLVDRRLVRQDHDRFYVPRSPDGQRLLDGIPFGQPADRDRKPPPLTQQAMFQLAADYFKTHRKQRIERIGDLSPWFAEIDLRIREQDYRTALRLMSTIDRDHLTGWGQSNAIAPWREELIDKLGDENWEVHNLSMLAYARRLEEDLSEAADRLKDAIKRAVRLRDEENLVRLSNELGSVQFENGEVTDAARSYERGRKAARKQRMKLEEARARDGLMLCDAEMGRFRRALDHHKGACQALNGLHDKDSKVLRAELLLNVGWIHSQLGRDAEALDLLREARKHAREQHEELLEGWILNSEAQVLIDGHPAQAIEPATEAVSIGARTRNPNLSRDANTSLALAHLCSGNLNAASEAADAASKYRQSRRALGAFALQGITAYRNGYLDKARLAFQDTLLQAKKLREHERRNYQVLDLDGLAQYGLALCGDRDRFDSAVRAYREARAITREWGVVRRALCLLDELGGHDPEELSRVRRAAIGRNPGLPQNEN